MALAEQIGRLDLIAYRDAIIADLRDVFAGTVATVEKFRGKRTAETIERYGFRTPAIWVVVTGLHDIEAMGALRVARKVLVALIVETLVTDGEADDMNLALVDALTMYVSTATWGGCAQEPSMMKATNGYGKSFDGTDVNQWTVMFEQLLMTDPLTPEEIAALPDLLRTYATYVSNPDNPATPTEEQQVNVREP